MSIVTGNKDKYLKFEDKYKDNPLEFLKDLAKQDNYYEQITNFIDRRQDNNEWKDFHSSMKNYLSNEQNVNQLKEYLKKPNYPKIDSIIKYLPEKFKPSKEELNPKLSDIDNLVRNYNPLTSLKGAISNDANIDKSTKDEITGSIISKLYQADTHMSLQKVKGYIYNPQIAQAKSEIERLATELPPIW